MVNPRAEVWNYAVNRYAQDLAMQAFLSVCDELTPEQREVAARNGLDAPAATAALQRTVDTRAVVRQLLGDHLGGEQAYVHEDTPIDQAYADGLGFMISLPNPFRDEMRRIFAAYL